MLIYIILFLFLKIVGNQTNEQNRSFSFYEVTAFNNRERSVLYSIHVKTDAVVFLNGVTNEAASPMLVLVNQCCTDEFEITLQNNDIEYVNIRKDSVLTEFKDLDENHQEDEDAHSKKDPILNKKFFDWGNMMVWVQNRLKKNSRLEKIIIGETYERRELFVLKLSYGTKRPAVFILGGEQGRDWMSPAVLLNFISEVLSSKYEVLVDIYDLYLMPVFNPDGYEHSITKQRLWNKNRKHFYPDKICNQNEDETAIGVNIERNWFFTNSAYVPEAECDSVFIGHKPLSEEEPIALSNFLNTIAVNLMAFIDVRGFAKLLTVPYAETSEMANNYAVLVEMLLHASDVAFTNYNVSYSLCNAGSCFYNHTGNSADWVKKNMNVPIVFTIYLKHDDTFLPRLEQIPTILLHFMVIVRETLVLAHSIYGPLFNCTTLLSSRYVIVVSLILLLHLHKIQNT